MSGGALRLSFELLPHSGGVALRSLRLEWDASASFTLAAPAGIAGSTTLNSPELLHRVHPLSTVSGSGADGGCGEQGGPGDAAEGCQPGGSWCVGFALRPCDDGAPGAFSAALPWDASPTAVEALEALPGLASVAVLRSVSTLPLTECPGGPKIRGAAAPLGSGGSPGGASGSPLGATDRI